MKELGREQREETYQLKQIRNWYIVQRLESLTHHYTNPQPYTGTYGSYLTTPLKSPYSAQWHEVSDCLSSPAFACEFH